MPARLLTTGTHKAQHNKALNWHKDRASGMWTYCVSKPSAIYACETWLRWCLVLTCLLIIPGECLLKVLQVCTIYNICAIIKPYTHLD